VLERWPDHMVKPNKTHRTNSIHRQQVRSHIAPALGRVKLVGLRKAHIDRALNLGIRGMSRTALFLLVLALAAVGRH
jgi:hypothetical protein